MQRLPSHNASVANVHLTASNYDVLSISMITGTFFWDKERVHLSHISCLLEERTLTLRFHGLYKIKKSYE